MEKGDTLKENLSPFMTVVFLVIAVTGLLMSFDIHVAGMGYLHKWLGIIFIIAGTVHLFLNWRRLRIYLTGRPAKAMILLAVLVAILVGISGHSEHEREHGERGHRRQQHGGIEEGMYRTANPD